MTPEYIKSRIHELRPWYQNIDFDGIPTERGKYKHTITGDIVWHRIKRLVGNLEGKKILDIGMNAGYYCMMTAMDDGCAVGIEKNQRFYEQAVFTRAYFEKKHGTVFPVTYFNYDVEKFDFDGMRKFDHIFCLGILYHLGRPFRKGGKRALSAQRKFLQKMTILSDSIVVRAKACKNNNPLHFTKLFDDFDFLEMGLIWEEDNRFLAIYKRS